MDADRWSVPGKCTQCFIRSIEWTRLFLCFPRHLFIFTNVEFTFIVRHILVLFGRCIHWMHYIIFCVARNGGSNSNRHWRSLLGQKITVDEWSQEQRTRKWTEQQSTEWIWCSNRNATNDYQTRATATATSTAWTKWQQQFADRQWQSHPGAPFEHSGYFHITR